MDSSASSSSLAAPVDKNEADEVIIEVAEESQGNLTGRKSDPVPSKHVTGLTNEHHEGDFALAMEPFE